MGKPCPQRDLSYHPCLFISLTRSSTVQKAALNRLRHLSLLSRFLRSPVRSCVCCFLKSPLTFPSLTSLARDFKALATSIRLIVIDRPSRGRKAICGNWDGWFTKCENVVAATESGLESSWATLSSMKSEKSSATGGAVWDCGFDDLVPLLVRRAGRGGREVDDELRLSPPVFLFGVAGIPVFALISLISRRRAVIEKDDARIGVGTRTGSHCRSIPGFEERKIATRVAQLDSVDVAIVRWNSVCTVIRHQDYYP